MSAARRPTTVAVLYAGWLSVRVPQRGEAARRNLINVLGADVFVAGTTCPLSEQIVSDASAQTSKAPVAAMKHRLARPSACSEGSKHCAHLHAHEPNECSRSPSCGSDSSVHLIGLVVAARFQASKTADGITIFAPVLGDRNLSVLRELHDYSRSIRLVEVHEARKRGGTRYARIVFSRLEFEWLAPHPPLGLLEPSSAVWLPSGGVSGGLNDRHALLSRSAADVYMKRWEVRGGSRAQQP